MERNGKVFIANHEGMIGSAILRRLKESGFTKIVVKTPSELDLLNQGMVLDFFMSEKPAYVFLASAKMGGILANTKYPAELMYTNIQSQTNIIHAAWKSGVKKLLFLGSSCIYPKECLQPMKEDYLMTGKLEPTSEPYALAKIAGIRMCQSYNRQYGTNFISAVPSDLYGPGDDFDPETAHVIPALIRKIHEAKMQNHNEVIVWGTGTPRRDALYIDDLADACVCLMDTYENSEMINIGSGHDFSIGELAGIITGVIGFRGKTVFDRSKPDGAPRKLLDTSRLTGLGWAPGFSLEEGIRQTYQWYINHEN